MKSTEELYQIADELRAIANLGLNYSKNEYDLDRYERILSASARLFGAIEHRSSEEVLEKFQNNMFHVSPLAGAEAAVLHDNQLLLVRRQDNGLWAIPGGLTEVGETLAEAAQRELWEETQLRGYVTKLIGVFDSRKWKSRIKVQMYHAVFLVECENPSPSTTSETTDVGFFSEDGLPPLSPGHYLRVPFVLNLLRDEKSMPYFDPPEGTF